MIHLDDIARKELSAMPTSRLVTTKELARALGVDPRTVRKAVAEGRLPAMRPRHALRFEPAAVSLALSNNAKSADKKSKR